MSTLTKVFTRIKKTPLTRKRIQEIFGISQSRALEIIQELRPQLVIVGYDQPPAKKPAPIYGHRTSAEQQDAILIKAPRKPYVRKILSVAEKAWLTRRAWEGLAEEEKERLRKERKLAYDRAYGARKRNSRRNNLSTPRVQKHRENKRIAKMIKTMKGAPAGIMAVSPVLGLSMFFNNVVNPPIEVEEES